MLFLLILLPFMSACQYLPDVAKDVESIETDTAVKIEVSREAIQKDTNVEITISVQNKDEPTLKSQK
jgi:hypothetical protein